MEGMFCKNCPCVSKGKKQEISAFLIATAALLIQSSFKDKIEVS